MLNKLCEKPIILTEPRREDERIESETKFFDVSYRSRKQKLSDLGMTRIFKGFIRTRLYNADLPPGVSTGTRETYDQNGRVRFFGRIKRNPVDEAGKSLAIPIDAPTDIVKNKWEQESEFDSRKEAEKWLISMRKERGIPVRASDLELDYEFGKNRISHIFDDGLLAPSFPDTQLDFDKIVEVNGKPINSLRWLEIQNTSDKIALEKRALILICAACLGVRLKKPDLARASTKTVLIKKGLL